MNDLISKKGIWIVNFTKEFWHSKDVSLGAKGVYAILKSFTNYNSSEAFPSMEYLSDLSGVNQRTLRRYISELKNKGFIKVERIKQKDGKFTKNVYTIVESEAEKIKYTSKNHRTKTTIGKNENKTIGQKTTGGKVPTKINSHYKDIISIANFLLFNYSESSDITALSKIINKYKRELGGDKLREVIGYLWIKEKTFDSLNNFAAYLEKCKPEKINLSFNPVEYYEQN